MKDLLDLIQKIDEVSETSASFVSEAGEPVLYKGFQRENLNKLKRLAPKHYSVLADALDATENERKRVLLCECLQYADASELQPLFRRLLSQSGSELRCCAMVALGKLGDAKVLSDLYPSILQTGDRRVRFFLGCALINVREKRGIDLLISVLREEKSFYVFKDGSLTTSYEGMVYAFTIDGILNGLIHRQSETFRENPFEWIAWWENHGDEIVSVDPSHVTPHLLEYAHDMIEDIEKKQSH